MIRVQSNQGPVDSRIKLLLEREGEAATIEWVKRTREIYREAINDPSKYSPAHKEGFSRQIEMMSAFLEERTSNP